jgi:hypothetical protein
MKRIVTSIGLVAVGASSIQAGLLQGLTTESGKPWNVSATLRGFYDDNVNTVPDNFDGGTGYYRGSTGFELSPSLQFAFPMEQTTLNFGYVYSLKYYEHKPLNNTENYDQTHEFSTALTHAFSERYQLTVRDSFVVGQEPDLLRAGSTFNSFQRVSGSNIRNYGAINFLAQMTPELGLEVGYANTFYSYSDNEVFVIPDAFGYSVSPSYSGVLDHIDHMAHIEGRYQIAPQTIGTLGYQFRDTVYIGNQPIGYDVARKEFVVSHMRNARSHYVYAGLTRNFRPDLTGSIQLGGRFTDYYNNPAGQGDFSPYANASLQYTYLPESYLQFGALFDYSATETFGANDAGDLTLNSQNFDVFVALRHRITPKLFGRLSAEFGNVEYYGGPFNNRTSRYYLLGLNLEYRFTPNFSAEIGYNYDLVNNEYQTILSGVSSVTSQYSYDRNRVYLGVTASY